SLELVEKRLELLRVHVGFAHDPLEIHRPVQLLQVAGQLGEASNRDALRRIDFFRRSEQPREPVNVDLVGARELLAILPGLWRAWFKPGRPLPDYVLWVGRRRGSWAFGRSSSRRL